MTRRAFVMAAAVVLGTLTGAARLGAADEKLKFELYKDNGGEFRWRLKEGDAILATSGQGYKAKADAKKGAERVKTDAADKLTFEVYEDAKQEFRWRAKVKNGNVIASSTKAFKAKADAEKAVKAIQDGAKDAEFVDETK